MFPFEYNVRTAHNALSMHIQKHDHVVLFNSQICAPVSCKQETPRCNIHHICV